MITRVRAAAGRISPIVLQQLLFLQAAGATAGQAATGLELVLMTHTDCAITRLLGPDHRQGLGGFLGCTDAELDGRSVGDPDGAVRVDIEALAANPVIVWNLAPPSIVAVSWARGAAAHPAAATRWVSLDPHWPLVGG